MLLHFPQYSDCVFYRISVVTYDLSSLLFHRFASDLSALIGNFYSLYESARSLVELITDSPNYLSSVIIIYVTPLSNSIYRFLQLLAENYLYHYLRSGHTLTQI